MFPAALFTIVRHGSNLSVYQWAMDKEDVRIYNGILLSHKMERNWIICRDTGGPTVCDTEWSKSEREKQVSYIDTYM